MEYHRPVLLSESIEGLRIQPSGIYCDVTFGGGGHSRSILSQLDDKGHLFAFDQDGDAARNLLHDQRFTFIHSNFRHLKRYMRYYDVPALDGVLADLGVSSFQFDNPERGFSYRGDQPMDMRMNTQQSISAADILQQYTQEQLVSLFSKYGQVRNARTLAAHIVQGRGVYQLSRVAGFLECIGPCIRGNRMRYLAQVFQSLRIEVNEEMDALVDLLEQATECLSPGGRLVVISYHSVEDQIVKRWMKFGNTASSARQEENDIGRHVLRTITKKPVGPAEKEIKENPRARSARLRIAEKE